MSDYWQKRALKAEKKVNDGAKQLEDVIAQAYKQAQSYLTKQISKLFTRTKQQTELDESEAKVMLNEIVPVSELVELKKLAKDISNPELQQAAKKRLTGLALKSRITRAEDLKAKSYLVSKQIADVQLEKQTSFYMDTINEAYKEASAETIIREAQTNAKNSVIKEVWNKKDYKFKELPTKAVENILDSRWVGSNYSKRLWGDTEALAKRLEQLFTVEALTGMSEFQMAKAIAGEFDRSMNIARRLIRTEANYMANQAKLKSWRDNGVEKYMIVAILDLRTSQICRHKDHKVYLVSEAVVNGAEGTYPPFHPWCRSVASMYSERLNKMPRKALNPLTGKTFDIKGGTIYDEWMNMLKSKHSDEEISNFKKTVLNRTKDNASYLKMKSVIGKTAPDSLEEYQEIKYNDGKQWAKLTDNYFVKSRLQDGRFGSTINPEKQAPHMASTVTKGKSYFEDDVDIQKLFDKYAGTGRIERTEAGKRTPKERIDTGKLIGYDASSEKPVTGIKIHHSKKRTHIVPWNSNGSKRDL